MRTVAGRVGLGRVSSVSPAAWLGPDRRTTAWKLHLPQGRGTVSLLERWSSPGGLEAMQSFVTSAKALRTSPQRL